MTAEEVYQELEKEIIIGILRPRERLVEAELCKKLRISRPLLREVFRRLQGAGLVILNPHRGVAVRDFTPQEIEEVYFVRILLEKAAVPMIMDKIDLQSLKELKDLNHIFEEACRSHDLPAMILGDLAFHRRLSQLSGNSFLNEFLEISRLQTHQARYISWLDQERIRVSLRDHKDLLLALARKDLAKFEAVILKQQEACKRDYHRIFSQHRNWHINAAETPKIKNKTGNSSKRREGVKDKREISGVGKNPIHFSK